MFGGMHDHHYFRLRGWIPIPLYALTLLAFDPLAPPAWEVAVGGGLALAGLALRAWARLQIGRSSDTRRLHARRLVTSGPYALARNPLYIGNLAIACGLAVLIGADHWAGVLVAALALHYGRVIRAEERMLEASFGEPYREYCSRVHRWWPVPRGFPAFEGGKPAFSSLRREVRIAALAMLCAGRGLAFRF